jgi:DNA-binding cell septation regulator SpoVG
MAKLNPDAEIALHKLGQRIREGHAIKHPAPDKSLETVKDAVREQYEKEQEAEREKKPSPEAEKEPGRQPEEPDHGR